MQNSEDELLYEELRAGLEIKFGRKIKYSKDCKLLSEQIFETINRQLSESTIKRFFGIITSAFKPSKFTLDTFSMFLGYEGWKSFVLSGNLSGIDFSGKNGQNKLKECFDSVTGISIQSMTGKAGYDPQRFIHRITSEARLMDFINSEKTATILVGPKGYGKTSLLLQLYHEHFTGRNRQFKDTFICIIDGGIFFSLYNLPKHKVILRPLIEFDVQAVQDFFQNPDKEYSEKKYLVIIDDVDKIFNGREKFFQLTGNIMQLIMINNRNPGFKIILTCAPENIDTISSFLLYNNVLAESFYDVNFKYRNQYEAINVPAFRPDEIRAALVKNSGISSYSFLSLYYPQVFEVIKIPYFLSFFLRNENVDDEEFSEISFLNKAVRHYIFSQPFIEEKQLVIKKFLQRCNRDEEFPSVEKEILLEDDNLRIAYQEIVNRGVMQEFTLPSETPDTRWKVRFTNTIIFEYLLARHLISDVKINKAFLYDIFKTYKDSISVQYALLKWIIKLAFQHSNTDLLKQIHQVMEQTVNVDKETAGDSMPGALRIVQNTYTEGLRTHKKVSELLMPWLAASGLGQKLFFEEYFDIDNLMHFPVDAMDVYSQRVNSPDAGLVSCYIKFAKGFYLLDSKQCSIEFEKLRQINYSEIKNPYFQGYYFSAYFMFAYLAESAGNMGVLDNVLACSEKLKQRHHQSLRFIPPFEYLIVFTLNTCDYFEEVLKLAEHMKSYGGRLNNLSSGYYQLFQLCHARALLHTGEERSAKKLFSQIVQGEFPFHMRHFMQLNVDLIMIDFLAHEDKTAEALRMIYESKALAAQMNFRFYIQKAAGYEAILLKARKDSP